MPRCSRLQLSRFTPLRVGCSRRSAADTDRSTSADKTSLRVVQRPMMMTTQQDQIIEICWATIIPMNDMVSIAPPRRSPTPRKRTPTIPDGQRPPLRHRRGSRFLTAVERNTILIQQDPRDRAVAGQHPGGVDTDRAHPIRPREPEFLGRRQQVFQGFENRSCPSPTQSP